MTDESATTTRRPPAQYDDSHVTPATAETAVPPGETPYVCSYCGYPFSRESHRTLHHGLEHYEALSDAERTAFNDAYTAEEDDLRRFRIISLGALVLLYFGFLFMYILFASQPA